MFPNEDQGRYTVSDDGTFVIKSAQKEDAGRYVCKAISPAGSAITTVQLDVRGQPLF